MSQHFRAYKACEISASYTWDLRTTCIPQLILIDDCDLHFITPATESMSRAGLVHALSAVVGGLVSQKSTMAVATKMPSRMYDHILPMDPPSAFPSFPLRHLYLKGYEVCDVSWQSGVGRFLLHWPVWPEHEAASLCSHPRYEMSACRCTAVIQSEGLVTIPCGHAILSS